MSSHATWAAIALGGIGGTLAALVGSGSAAAPRPVSTESVRPIAEVAMQMQAAVPKPKPSSAAPATSAVPSAVPSAAPSAARDASSAPSIPDLPALPLPASKKELLREEMRCDQRKAESCMRAALSYEDGAVDGKNIAKASKYRRIALTSWISQCDHNVAAACLTLASLYRTGNGVPMNERTAGALLDRTRELCRYNQAKWCRDLLSQ